MINDLKTSQGAFILAAEFLKEYKKIKLKNHFSLSGVKKTIWWPYFLAAYRKFGDRKEWNARVFVKSQFEKFEKVYPTQLVKDISWNTFEEYKHRFLNIDDSKSMVRGLASLYKQINDWSIKSGFDTANFEAFINDETNRRSIERGIYNLHLFTVSKSFRKFLFSLPPFERNVIMTNEEYEKKRALIFFNKPILRALRKLMKDEFQ